MKRRPYRNREFMRFCHEHMRGLCCKCEERPWTELHHFGGDGGMSMKPSDLQVARLCKICHDKFPFKARALRAKGKWEILSIFCEDALQLNEAWIKHVEAGRPVVEEQCSLDELTQWLIGNFNSGSLADVRKWMIHWADRRASELYSCFFEEEDAE